MDSAPIIYVLDGHATLGPAYLPLFEAVAAGRNRVVVSTTTVAEVLGGPLRHGQEVLSARHRHMMTRSAGWRAVDLTVDIAEHAACIRARHGLKLPAAIQVATALAVDAFALVTHDRDFSASSELPILSAPRPSSAR